MDDRHLSLEHPDRFDDPDRNEIALLDHRGVIVGVNEAWNEFCRANGGDVTASGVGSSYLDACDRAADDPDARATAAAIRAVLAGDTFSVATLRFRCDAPTEERWFEIMVSARPVAGQPTGATVVVTPLRPRRLLDATPSPPAIAEQTPRRRSEYLDAIALILDDLAGRDGATDADPEDPLVAGLIELSRVLLRRYERLSILNAAGQPQLGPVEHLIWLRRQAEADDAEHEASDERPAD